MSLELRHRAQTGAVGRERWKLSEEGTKVSLPTAKVSEAAEETRTDKGGEHAHTDVARGRSEGTWSFHHEA